jgi:multiple sugar transport system substrate-binding protein
MPGHVKGLEMYIKAVQNGMAPNSLSVARGDGLNAITAGNLVLGVDWKDPMLLCNFTGATPAWLRHQYVGSPILGANQYYDWVNKVWVNQFNRVAWMGFGGWQGMISKASKNPQACYDLLTYLGGPVVHPQICAVPGANSFVRNTELYRPTVDLFLKQGLTPSDIYNYIFEMEMPLFNGSLPNVMDLRISGTPQLQDALNTNLAKAIAGEMTPQDALNAAATAWNSINEGLGMSTQLAAYRGSLGITT